MYLRDDSIHEGRKFTQVLQGARDVFMSDGFDGASVDQIARTAGVSKATLYKYFPDKRTLFMEVARRECQRQSHEALDKIDMNALPQQVLGQAGRHFLEFITSTLGQQVFRVCLAEADRFPQLGQQFYSSGPAVMCAKMAAYFEAAEARGELRIPDKPLAAAQFGELCKADVWMRLIFGVSKSISQDDINRVVDSAVETFLARYGT